MGSTPLRLRIKDSAAPAGETIASILFHYISSFHIIITYHHYISLLRIIITCHHYVSLLANSLTLSFLSLKHTHTLTHSHTYSLTHTHTNTLTHSFTLLPLTYSPSPSFLLSSDTHSLTPYPHLSFPFLSSPLTHYLIPSHFLLSLLSPLLLPYTDLSSPLTKSYLILSHPFPSYHLKPYRAHAAVSQIESDAIRDYLLTPSDSLSVQQVTAW